MQQIRQKQVHGLNGGSLEDDMREITGNLQHFDVPVKTRADLPLEGNTDGDMRVVTDEDAIYIWDEETGTWSTKGGYYTEATSKELIIGQDGQSIINTQIKVGQEGGMPTTSSIQLFVNGIIQKQEVDYVVTIDSNFNCVLEWTSRDFPLEVSDTITMSYDALFLS